jgi:hypothetical protein
MSCSVDYHLSRSRLLTLLVAGDLAMLRQQAKVLTHSGGLRPLSMKKVSPQ